MIKDFFQGLLNNRFARFLLVGGLNTLFGYSIFSFFIFINFHYSIAALSATITGVIFNFLTTGHLVFQNRSKRLIGRFIIVYALLYGLNVLGLRMLALLGTNSYVSGAIMLFPIACLGFILFRTFVFSGGPVRSKSNDIADLSPSVCSNHKK